MSDIKSEFYKTLNNIVGDDRLSDEEIYIINDYLGRLEATIKELQQENKQLKEKIQKLKDYGEKVGNRRNELYDKIDKAIEKIYKIIESNNSALSNPEYTIVSKHKLLELSINECKELLEILGEKENDKIN